MLKMREPWSRAVFQSIVIVGMLICAGCVAPKAGKEPLSADGLKEPNIRKAPDIEKAVAARVMAGSAYLESGDYERAHRHLDRALELDPNSSLAHGAAALLYRFEGDVVKEEAHYKKALQLDSSNSPVHHNYGSFLCGQGRYEEAEREFRLVVADYKYEHRGQSYENLGRCLLKQGKKQAAEQAFAHAYRLDKNLPRTVLALAVLYFDLGRNQDAYQLFKRYEEIAKATPESLWLGIRLERIFGDLDALASYEVTLKNLFPGSKEYEQYYRSTLQGSTTP